MTKQEILVTTIGEMSDMISCLAIYRGVAQEKRAKPSLEKILMMR